MNPRLMPWTPAHTLLLIVCPLAIFGFFYLRRFEDDGYTTPYTIAMRRFRFAMLISGVGGLLGLLRFWYLYR
jgi:hypothetical protein